MCLLQPLRIIIGTELFFHFGEWYLAEYHIFLQISNVTVPKQTFAWKNIMDVEQYLDFSSIGLFFFFWQSDTFLSVQATKCTPLPYRPGNWSLGKMLRRKDMIY